MVYCAAFNCNSHSDKKEPGITFHRFPKDVEKRNLWAKNVKRGNWEPSITDRLCSLHFEEHCFKRNATKTFLKKDAIPTKFAGSLSYLQPKKAIKRSRPMQTSDPVPSTSTMPTTPINQTKARAKVLVVEDDTPQTQKLTECLFQLQAQSKIKSRKIKILRQCVRRYKKRVVSLKQIVRELQNTI